MCQFIDDSIRKLIIEVQLICMHVFVFKVRFIRLIIYFKIVKIYVHIYGQGSMIPTLEDFM
jgi:hypothetical protein